MSSFLFAILLALPKLSLSACHGSKTSYRGEFMGKLTVDNQVLLGHVIAAFSVKRFTECFTHCDNDCRCRSFNLPMSGEGQCELNSADNSTALMKPKRGWRYHHLEVKEIVAGADTCYEPYSNGCCKDNPCANGAVCKELGDRGKPGFNCTCANEYNTGPLCQRQINSCFDYLWNDKTAKSGYYDIWEKNTLVKSTVYCDMRPDKWEAWTLVMSYSKGNADNLEPFYVDAPRDESNADSGNYSNTGSIRDDPYWTSKELSLAKMQSVQNGMSGRDVQWKATCNYAFADGQATSDDVVRSSFETLNLFSFVTNEIGLVGLYPFDNVTKGQDMSGYGNHATMQGITYEKGPLDNPGRSARVTKDLSSIIELKDNSGRLDTQYSLTIIMQLYTYVKADAHLIGWRSSSGWGPFIRILGQTIHYRVRDRQYGGIRVLESHNQITQGQWHHIAVTYDYENSKQAIYCNGTRKNVAEVSPNRELGTQNAGKLTIGAVYGDSSVLYNGRVACVKIYNTGFTDDEAMAATKNWECPHEPASNCHRVDYIKIRGRECYNCNVWATQINTEIFSINAYRGDQKCNFNSGSTIPDENIFGVYKVVDASTHTCTGSNSATTQYWFGGKL